MLIQYGFFSFAINIFLFFTIFTIHSTTTEIVNNCNQLTISDGQLVCICNSTYCDTVPKLEHPTGNSYQLYTTTRSTLGFSKIIGDFQQSQVDNPPQCRMEIDRNKIYQKIVGFGGAFTDSTGYNILSLPTGAQQQLLKSYFGPDGIEYSLCRVPIGGTDFSLRLYSYDDDHPNDTTLEYFQLQKEDFLYKIPMIQQAQNLRGDKKLQLLASVWSAPKWMKTNNKFNGTGRLKREYYQVWAEYFLKFFRKYHENGIDFWGTTTQNEPSDGLIPFDLMPIANMGWMPSAMNEWIGNHVGPTLRNSEFKDIKIIILDDSRHVLPLLPLLLNNENTLNYTDGVAVHWYLDKFLPDSLLELTKSDKKDLFLLNTEACNGFLHFLGIYPSVDLGSWQRGQNYIESILNYLEFGSVGWIDWNMVLNRDGGPANIKNEIDSPIIVDGDIFYKQPMFYAIGHFSKFILPDSVRIDSKISGVDGVRTIAFLRPDNLTAIVIYNKNSDFVDLQIQDDSITIRVNVTPDSLNTLIY